MFLGLEQKTGDSGVDFKSNTGVLAWSEQTIGDGGTKQEVTPITLFLPLFVEPAGT